jgi:hypothetical protein
LTEYDCALLTDTDNPADMRLAQDNSGTIERDEFLSLPQISSNPLATRYFLPHRLLCTHVF